MGEVRVLVMITNKTDVTNSEHGLIPESEVRSTTVEAIVDTGAMTSVLPDALARDLGLTTSRTKRFYVADGSTVDAAVTDPVEFEFNGRTALESCAIMGDVVLLGQLFLEQTDLFVDAAGGRLVGNPDHPDEVVVYIRTLASA